ncbi:MAG TPA: PrsW family intramembrane metalloprotease, partial [Ktedonobacteraceae bacterium]|nr:PrsW family intramembrane metalloprotease [Ktedonobacteraceae bacterium]
TAKNIVRVNGHPVPSGSDLPVQPQDIVILGNTMLQLIAPLTSRPAELNSAGFEVSPDLDDMPWADIVSRMDTHPIRRIAASADQAASPNGTSIEQARPSAYDGKGLAGSKMPQFAPGQQFPTQPQQSSWQQHVQRSVPSARQNGQRNKALTSALPVQPDPELMAQPWDEAEESLLGTGVTMQFALPQHVGVRTRWLIAGIGLAILVLSVAITIVLNGLLGLNALAQNGISTVLAALTIPLLPAIGINLLVNFMDRYEREPWFLRLAAFLWGAIIAIPPAFFVEQNVDSIVQNLLGPNTSEVIRSALDGLNAGVTEETIKGLGLILLFFILRDEFDNVTDGIIYAALIGAGFAFVENFSYFAINAKDTLVFLIVGRIMLGWLGHSTFTACFGAALGYIRHTHVRWKQIAIPLLGFAIAVGLHSFYDFVDFQAGRAIHASPYDTSVALFSLIAIIGDYIPPFLAQVALLYILVKALAHEAAVIREFLAAEVSNGVVMVNEYALLQNSFQRTKEERRVLRRSGIRQWLRVKALYQTEIGLAFRKWHVFMGDRPKLGYRQPEDAYRERIRRLRNEMRAAEMNSA